MFYNKYNKSGDIMKIRLFTSIKNIFTKKNNLNTNINYNPQLRTMLIPSNISPKKELTAAEKMDKICKLIIKRLDSIDKRNQEMLILLNKKK